MVTGPDLDASTHSGFSWPTRTLVPFLPSFPPTRATYLVSFSVV
ncbi:hypothetical protein CGRA01v4_06330 [Colletotrichum graminicola]|nr:hypothetical protein CGRA01v4_06330 [Colletotrichum graminicola]